MVQGQISGNSVSAGTFVKLLLLIIGCYLFWQPAGSLSAQDSNSSIPLPPITPRFGHLTIGDGLAHNHVSAIIQDQYGFMWFGTFDGLNRYDGYTFTRFRHDPDIPTSLSSNNISAVIEGPNGFIWVATEDGGLNRVDPSLNPDAGQVVRYQHDSADENSLSDNHIESLAFDEEGILWIGTGSGVLNRFDPGTESFAHYQPPTIEPEPTPIEAIVVSRNGGIWVGSEALFHFDPGTERFTPYAVTAAPPNRTEGGGAAAPPSGPPDGPPAGGGPPGGGGPGPGAGPPGGQGAPIPSFAVNALYEDESGRLWVGSNYLYLLNPGTRRFIPYSAVPAVPFQGITGDAAGRLWVASSRGLYIFDPQTEQFERSYGRDENNSGGLATSFVSTIYRSPEELMLIGTSGGLHIYDWRQAPFFAYPSGAPPTGLGMSAIHTMVIGPDDDLWVTGGPSITRVDHDSGLTTSYQVPLDFLPNESPLIVGIMGLHFDSQGSLWFDNARAIVRLDTMTEGTESYPLPDAETSRILVMRADSQGILWVLSSTALYRFDPQLGQFTDIYRNDPDDPESFPESVAATISIDDSGMIWISGAGFLTVFDPQTEQFHHYIHNPDDPASMTNGQATAVYRAGDGIVWFSSESGLLRLDEAAGTFTRYTESDGLPSNAVLGLLADGQGHLWLSTFRGLSRFDIESETFRNYDHDDGIPFDEFIGGSYMLAPDGRMYFGGRGGMVAFYPEEVVQNDYLPPVVLTELRLANEPVFSGQENGILSTPIWNTDNLTFNYDQDIIAFEFSALSYAAPQDNRYRYRLEGLEAEWNEVDSSGRSARYTTLPPGNYVLRVQGSNNDGLWSDQEVALNVAVRPPWWQTIWFQGGMFLLVVGLAVSGYRWRVYTIQRRNEELEREVAARTQELAESNEQLLVAKEAAEVASQAKSTFLSSMSHELRTPLNGVLGYAQILQRDRSLAPNQADGVKIIYESGHHLLTLINDVLDLAKVEAGKLELVPTAFRLESFLDGIAAVARMSAQQKDIRFTYQPDPNLPLGVQADEKRLRQILLNLLGNAIKFTDEGEVTLRVMNRKVTNGRQQEAHLRFEVEDTGVGMAAHQLEAIFIPFEQVGDERKRAAGTGLGLPISQQLVGLMDSKIEVSSTPGQGSTFWFEVSLPVMTPTMHDERPTTAAVIGYEGPRRRILVADDRRENRMVLLNMLEPLGFEVTLAADGREALDSAEQSPPDLILMDLVMPVMTGFETVQVFRQTPKFQDTPIIGISASVFAMDQAKSRLAGCDAFLPKPVEAGRLLSLIEELLDLTWIQDEPEPVVAAPKAIESAEPLTTPPLQELESLYELAMLGKMTRIRERVGRLEAADSRYAPFARRIRQLADAFEDKQIADFLQAAMSNKPSTESADG